MDDFFGISKKEEPIEEQQNNDDQSGDQGEKNQGKDGENGNPPLHIYIYKVSGRDRHHAPPCRRHLARTVATTTDRRRKGRM